MPLEIVPARTGRGLRRFVDVPWHVYDPAAHPQWVPPLRIMVRDALSPKHPFWRAADRELFVALRDGRPVGRVAAIENRAHNEFHGDRVGFFGFFECREDEEAAAALLGAAGAWLGARGLDTIRGPMNPSTNYDCGVLVRGFRWPPAFLTPWNPRYYATLLEGQGFTKARDLLAYFIPMDDGRFALPERFAEHAERAVSERKIVFRDLDMRRFDVELERCWDVYNAAWERNWGFVPMTRDEFVRTARDLKHLLVPEFAFGADVDGETVGFCFVVPDFNHVLKRVPDGRLFPTGLVKLLLGRRRLRVGRVVALGVKREHRTRGVFALFAHELYRRGRAYGAVGAEASWILEDNDAINRPLQALGVKEYRRWRVYERAIGAAAGARGV
jgi:GNAT superfamily N-acetyltransferase